MTTIQQQLNDLAESCGVDPITVEIAAQAVVQRLHKWYGDDIEKVGQEDIEVALIDFTKEMKHCAIKAHMNITKFGEQVLELARFNPKHPQALGTSVCE
ncbi:hypothetical protein D7I39_11090 [Allopusillimonas ginsengisoli]|nr:hypothetical protein D7I39_11090 [Allopusillimonas ginsengisoli]